MNFVELVRQKLHDFIVREYYRENTINVTEVAQCLRYSFFNRKTRYKEVHYVPIFLGLVFHDVFSQFSEVFYKDLTDEWKLGGHVDAVINDKVFEIKTIRRMITKPHMMSANQAAYYYMMSKKSTNLVYVNTRFRANREGSIKSFNIISDNEEEMLSRARRYLEYVLSNKMPEGEKSSFCKVCPLQEDCHPTKELPHFYTYVDDYDDYWLLLEETKKVIEPVDIPYFCIHAKEVIEGLKEEPVLFNKCLNRIENNTFYLLRTLIKQETARVLTELGLRALYDKTYLYTIPLNSVGLPEQPFDVSKNAASYYAEKEGAERIVIVIIDRENNVRAYEQKEIRWEKKDAEYCKFCNLKCVCPHAKL